MSGYHGTNRVSAVVCAYNEQETVGDIVAALARSRLIDEVIVVNDGSTDGTARVLDGFSTDPKVRVIGFRENRGKGFAMACGTCFAGGEILVFFDADLKGRLDDDQVAGLISPLLSGRAHMVIGYIVNNPLERFYNPFRPISGQRVVFKKDLIPILDEMRESRFGIETVINLYFLRDGKKVQYHPIRDMVHITKVGKYPMHVALWGFYKEGTEIANSLRLHYPILVEHLKNRSRRIVDSL